MCAAPQRSRQHGVLCVPIVPVGANYMLFLVEGQPRGNRVRGPGAGGVIGVSPLISLHCRPPPPSLRVPGRAGRVDLRKKDQGKQSLSASSLSRRRGKAMQTMQAMRGQSRRAAGKEPCFVFLWLYTAPVFSGQVRSGALVFFFLSFLVRPAGPMSSPPDQRSQRQ